MWKLCSLVIIPNATQQILFQNEKVIEKYTPTEESHTSFYVPNIKKVMLTFWQDKKKKSDL